MIEFFCKGKAKTHQGAAISITMATDFFFEADWLCEGEIRFLNGFYIEIEQIRLNVTDSK